MPEYTPLTKEERAATLRRFRHTIHEGAPAAIAIERYEATVAAETKRREDAEAKVAALEARLAEAQRYAEVGRAVEGMAVGDELRRGNEMAWTLTRHNDVHRHGFTALAALAAAKGEGDE